MGIVARDLPDAEEAAGRRGVDGGPEDVGEVADGGRAKVRVVGFEGDHGFTVAALERAGDVESAWAAQGCFNVTSTRVFGDQFCQKKHSPYEYLKRDDHSSKNELKRVETGRDMSLES